jgi:hypothetical protein
MLNYSCILSAECDVQDGKKCWKESYVTLEAGEKVEDAKALLESIGWEFVADNYSICPFCSKGIEENKGLKRLK